MAKADGEQILVSDVLKSILGAAKDLCFNDMSGSGSRDFPERWRLWEVTWRSESRGGCQPKPSPPGGFRVAASHHMSDGRRNVLCYDKQ